MFSYETRDRALLGGETINDPKLDVGLMVVQDAVAKENQEEKFSSDRFFTRLKILADKSRVRFALVISLVSFMFGSTFSTGYADNQDEKSGEKLSKPLIGDSVETEIKQSKYDFWQIAKIKLAQDPNTGKTVFVNTLPEGSKGFVYDLGIGSPPYDVEGYRYLGAEDMSAGVTIYWYEEVAVDDNLYPKGKIR